MIRGGLHYRVYSCKSCGTLTFNTNPTLCDKCTRKALIKAQAKIEQALERIALGWGGPSGPVLGDVQAILSRKDDD